MRTHEGTTKEGKEKGAVTPLNQRPDGAATRSDRNCDVDERSYGVEVRCCVRDCNGLRSQTGMEYDNLKTQLKECSDRINALQRRLEGHDLSMNVQMKVFEERIESIYAQYFKVIEALKEKNDDMLKETGAMKELDRERKELKEKKEELLKLEAMMKADKEVLVGEINERLSKLKDYMTTSEKDTAAMIANLTEKLSKVVKPS
ncbi:centromere protein F-like isoform X2 [Vigna unguiculata]|nr:centromere protein F-like isoform X2 [Vigna unguiculata]XP_027928390.1 centromere protein F-like isoform X2 [Vigna unguiculata]